MAKEMNKRIKLYVSLWWLVQLCGMFVLGAHPSVEALLLFSLAGFVFGGRKVALVSSLGLASYAALTLIGAMVLYLLEEWVPLIKIIGIAVLNLVISFWTIKKLNQ